MLLHIDDLIDEQKCYEEVRQLRWAKGVRCPYCNPKLTNKPGFHTHQAYHLRQFACLGLRA
jgi:hypothetical protein